MAGQPQRRATGRPATAGGDVDLARMAALFADAGRARILLALLDGRALPASVLAAEAGVSAPATSSHLAKLVEAELITVEKSGRHRYHRLASEHVSTALEALAALSGPAPVRSLRAHTRAAALREARSCYDHLAGTWGVAISAALLDQGALRATDGITDTHRRDGDPYSKPLPNHPYELGPDAEAVFALLELDLDAVINQPSRRPLLRFCLDWSEQRHHLGGRLGAALLTRLRERDWVRSGTSPRTLIVTERGHQGLTETLRIGSDRESRTGLAASETM